MVARGSGQAPGHCGRVVSEAESAVGAQKDDAAMAAQTVIEVGDGFASGDLRRGSVSHAIGSPLAEDEFHDGFAPTGERDGRGKIVSITAATYKR